MLTYNVQWFDVSEGLKTQQQPVFVLKRPLLHGDRPKGNLFATSEVARKGEFWVPEGNLLAATPQELRWALTRTGEFVRIPITAYRCQRSLAALMGVGVQVGLAAVAGLREQTQDRPLEAFLVLGHEVSDLATAGEDAFRGYIGIALRTK